MPSHRDRRTVPKSRYTYESAWRKKNAGNHSYTFEWKHGGYNSVRANSMKDALAKAKAMGQGGWRGGYDMQTLVPEPTSFRQDDSTELLRAYDRRWYT